MEAALMIQRSAEQIAAEINSIKDQTRSMLLYNSIEIGRRLVEAKTTVHHGEWGKWLTESVDYSQSTANNLMRIFEEYGSKQLALLSTDSNSQALGNLNYTQALSLLKVPEEERDAFIEDHDVPNMSTRELQQAIKDREQAIKDKKELEKKLDKAIKEVEESKRLSETLSKSYDELSETNTKHFKNAEELRQEIKELKKALSKAEESGDNTLLESLQASLNSAEDKLNESNSRIKELEEALKEKPIEVNAQTIVEKIPEEVEKELQELRKKVNQQANTSTVKFSVYFNELVENFKSLLIELEEIKVNDSQEFEKYKKAVLGLVGKMTEKL